MSGSKIKVKMAAKLATVDFGSIGLFLSEQDLQNLRRTPEDSSELIQARAVWILLSSTIIPASFPQGMDRRDGKVWSQWQEIFEKEDVLVTVTWDMVDWLKRIVTKDDTRVTPVVVRWREVLCAYLENVRPEE